MMQIQGCVVIVVIVLLVVFGESFLSSETSTVMYKRCANVFETPTNNAHLKGFAVAFNVNIDACTENCADRPWCAAVLYDTRTLVCYVLFEEDLREVDGMSYENHDNLACVMLKKLDFAMDLLEVLPVYSCLLFNTIASA